MNKKTYIRCLTVLIVCLLLLSLTGCAGSNNETAITENWDQYVQISNITIKKEEYSNKVIGQIENLTDKYYDVTIKLSSTDESTVGEISSILKLRPNEVAEFMAYTTNSQKTDYIVNGVKLVELEIPELGDGPEISSEALEYYFPKIYADHKFLMNYIKDDFKFFPQFDEIVYANDSISITSDSKKIHVKTYWNAIDSEMIGITIDWPENYEPPKSTFFFPYCSVFGFDATMATDVSKAMYKHDGGYLGNGWEFGAYVEDKMVNAIIVREEYIDK